MRPNALLWAVIAFMWCAGLGLCLHQEGRRK